MENMLANPVQTLKFIQHSIVAVLWRNATFLLQNTLASSLTSSQAPGVGTGVGTGVGGGVGAGGDGLSTHGASFEEIDGSIGDVPLNIGFGEDIVGAALHSYRNKNLSGVTVGPLYCWVRVVYEVTVPASLGWRCDVPYMHKMYAAGCRRHHGGV